MNMRVKLLVYENSENYGGIHMEEIEIIQGDSLATIVKIENPDEMNISRVVFACPSLEIEKDLIPANTEDDSEWALVMSPEDTITLWVGR